ncbi:MAG: hypothetical protein KH359_06575 [Clostridiales bacterium]|nr:hypothetical protein [Clostridiales bacterium]
MINTIIQGRMLVFVQQVNVLLYYVRKLPFVGEKIPYRLYGETDIKKAIGAIPVVFSVIGAFVGTFLYFLLMIKLPANWIQGCWEKEGIFVDQKAVMVYLFLIFSFLPGSFLVSNLTEGAKKDYVLLHVMRIPAAQHYRSQMVLKGVKDTICFLVPLLWFGFGAESALFVVSLFFTRYIGHAGILQHYRHSEKKGKKVFWKSFGKTFLVFGIILALGYGVAAAVPRLFFDRYVMAEVVVFLSFTLVGIFCFSKVWNYGGYTIFAKKMVSLKDFLEQDDAVKEARVADVQIQDKDISKEELSSRKYEEKEGYDYLNAIFFERHKRIVSRAVKSRIIIILAVGLIGAVALLFMGEQMKQKTFEAMTQMMPVMVFVMYLESTGGRICKAMFFNCDISLLKYGYYREADVILKNFKIRLRKLLMLDAVPAAIICGMILLWTLLCGEILAVWKVIPLMAGSLLLSAFFCLFHLFMYYITQPYTEEKTVKSPIFSVVNALVYFGCYLCLQIQTGSWLFTLGVLAVTIIFIPLSYFCVFRFAPKTFKIR